MAESQTAATASPSGASAPFPLVFNAPQPRLLAALAALTARDEGWWRRLLARPGTSAWPTPQGVGYTPRGGRGFEAFVVRSGAEAWELLEARGLVATGGGRAFACDRCGASGTDPDNCPCLACVVPRYRRPEWATLPPYDPAVDGVLDAPAHAADALLLAAADPAALAAAEQLALEAAARLHAAGVAAAPTRVLWQRRRGPGDGLDEGGWRLTDKDAIALPGWPGRTDERDLGRVFRDALRPYSEAVEAPAAYRRRARDATHGFWWDRARATEPNPYRPLVDLWRAGYALRQVDAYGRALLAYGRAADARGEAPVRRGR